MFWMVQHRKHETELGMRQSWVWEAWPGCEPGQVACDESWVATFEILDEAEKITGLQLPTGMRARP